MAGYAKLFSTIVDSSLWSESKDARLLFLTMLAKADQTGFIETSVSGLARAANLTLEETKGAMEVLLAPDPESKSKVAEGRRVAIVPRGFCLINYEEHRDRGVDGDERREYMREYMRKYRTEHAEKFTDSDGSKHSVNNVNFCKPQLDSAEAEAEALEKEKAREPEPVVARGSGFARRWGEVTGELLPDAHQLGQVRAKLESYAVAASEPLESVADKALAAFAVEVSGWSEPRPLTAKLFNEKWSEVQARMAGKVPASSARPRAGPARSGPFPPMAALTENKTETL